MLVQERISSHAAEVAQYARHNAALIGATCLAAVGASGLMAPESEALTLRAGAGATPAFMKQVRAYDEAGFLPSPRGDYIVTHDAIEKECGPADMGKRSACTILGLNKISFDASLKGKELQFMLGHEKGWMAEESMAGAYGNVFTDTAGLVATVNPYRLKALENAGIAKDADAAVNIINYDTASSDGDTHWYVAEFMADMYGWCDTQDTEIKSPSVTLRFDTNTRVKLTAKQYAATCATMKWQLEAHPEAFEPIPIAKNSTE